MPTDSTLAERDEAIKSVEGLIWRVARDYVRRFGGQVEDAYQESVAHLCANWPKYDRTKSAFTSWVMLTCKRQLTQSYALGRLEGPAVRVSYPAFKRGERTKVSSIHAKEDSYDWHETYLHDREPKPITNESEFIEFAEKLVGRRLSQIERHVYISRFVEGKNYQEIAEIFPRNKNRRLKEVMQRFATEARRNRHKAMGKS